MDYTKFLAPFISYKEIKRQAQKFRDKYQSDGSNPLNIYDIIEFDFGITIIPSPNLQSRCNTDAFITSSWKEMYVDQNQYENELNKRINFSVSHEIAHLILHKKVYTDLKISSVENLYKFMEQCPEAQYAYMEGQANAFAGNILVPKIDLEKNIEKLTQKVLKEEMLGGLFLDSLCTKFNVTSHVIFRRIMKENIEIDKRLSEYIA